MAAAANATKTIMMMSCFFISQKVLNKVIPSEDGDRFILRNHRKKPAQLCFIGLFAILANFERFRILYRRRLFLAVPFFQRLSDLRSNAPLTLLRKPLFAVSDLRRHLIQVSSYPRKPLIKLRGVGVHGVYLLGKHRTNVEGHVRPERIRPLKVVLEIQEHRILFERRRVSRHVWDGYHVGGILYKYTCIAMIRM